jgi:hypothetical protein
MGDIQEIFTRFAPEYLDRYQDRMPKNHIKALKAIISCRTAACGLVVYECEACGQVHVGFRSCGNRHCTICQHHKTRQWLERQLQRQLPGHHFMITFTVPEQLRAFFRSNQRKAYTAMFAASSQTLKLFAADDQFIGGDLPGFFGVLHTWGRQLQYHPHIHYVVPGGAVSRADGKWHPSRLDFFAPVRAMSKVFKAKLRDQLKAAGLLKAVDPSAWCKTFNVNCQAVANSRHSIRYLAPYVFKVAISDSRIVNLENRNVIFKYKKPGSRRWRTMALGVMEFMRRFLQHVLPTGFMKIRYYGFMSPASSVSLDRIRALIEWLFGFNVNFPDPEPEPIHKPTCPDCGGNLKLRYHVFFPYPLPGCGCGEYPPLTIRLI